MILKTKVRIKKEEVENFYNRISCGKTIPKILEAQKEQKDELLTIKHGCGILCKKSSDRQSTIGFDSEKYKNSFPRPKRIATTNYWLKSEILSFQKSLDV
jgi:predicted DNA-binding transcriptional regulator AlpA